MENKDNIREPEIQIVEIRRAIPQSIKRFVSDIYKEGVIRPAFNSANSDINLGELRKKLDYLA